jgi:hypothetical protein
MYMDTEKFNTSRVASAGEGAVQKYAAERPDEFAAYMKEVGGDEGESDVDVVVLDGDEVQLKHDPRGKRKGKKANGKGKKRRR